MVYRTEKNIFEGNAVRKILQPEKIYKKNNVLRLSEKDLRKARRLGVNPLKAIASIMCITAIFSMVAYVVYGQVQLTELTEKINVSSTNLQQLESVEIQLQMQATSNTNVSELENLARNNLSMEKINNGQISYINLATIDKGKVIVEDSQNIFEKFLDAMGF